MSVRVVAAAGSGAWRDRVAIAVGAICLLGIGIAGYLTYVHYAGIKVACVSSRGCETVQSSRYATLVGVPVAVFGLIGYVAILGSVAVRGEAGRALGAGLALIGFGFSAYLTYRELFTIHAICQWCVGSAVLMTALAVLTVKRLLDDEVREGSGPQSVG
jgi:uncharacterized membrane protein